MIESNVELYGLEESVINNIAITVSRDLAKVLNLPDDTKIRFNTETKTTYEKNVNGDIIGTASTPANEFVITVEESPSREQYNLLRYKSTDYPPIFRDYHTGLLITPIYNHKVLNFRCIYASESKSKVFAIANHLGDFVNRYSNYRYHNLEYSYPLGNSIMNLLHTVNAIRNMKANDNLTFREYVDKYNLGRIFFTIPETTDIKNLDLSVQEKQYSALGEFDSISPDIRPNYNSELSRWELELSYVLDFEKPIRLNVKYPILIYNTLIPEEFRNIEEYDYLPYHLKHSSVGINRHYPHNRYCKTRFDTYPIINIPRLDKWYPPNVDELYIPIISFLCMIKDKDTILFNMHDMSGLKFHNCVKEYIIQEEGKSISKSRSGIFLFKLFENDRPSSITLTIDKDGNVTSSEPLDVRKLYRVVVYVISNLDFLNMDSSKKIYKILNSDCNKLLKDNHIIDDGYEGIRIMSLFDQDIFNMLARGMIDTRTIEYKLPVNMGKKLVNVFTIITSRAILKNNHLIEESEDIKNGNCDYS